MEEMDLAGLPENDLAGLEYGELPGELGCETNPSISSSGRFLSDLGIFIIEYQQHGRLCCLFVFLSFYLFLLLLHMQEKNRSLTCVRNEV
jgi:hypothetical protein